MTEPIGKLIVEELGELLTTASKLLPPVEFAKMVVNENVSDRQLQAIIAAATHELKERGINT